jgi:predicted XRE-type DNA-binding protein
LPTTVTAEQNNKVSWVYKVFKKQNICTVRTCKNRENVSNRILVSEIENKWQMWIKTLNKNFKIKAEVSLHIEITKWAKQRNLNERKKWSEVQITKKKGNKIGGTRKKINEKPMEVKLTSGVCSECTFGNRS